MQQRTLAVTLGAVLGATIGCGSTPQEPAFPTSSANKEEAADPGWETDPQYNEAGATEPPKAQPPSASRKAPEFTDGMTVQQAMSAVPSDYDFVGIEGEVLSKPLREFEFYAPCKLKATDKFTLRLAVWDGRVVGADVKSANKALAQCIDGLVRKLEYKEKVESINTVEFSF